MSKSWLEDKAEFDSPLTLITNLPDTVLNTVLVQISTLTIFAGTQMIFGLIMHMALVYTVSDNKRTQ